MALQSAQGSEGFARATQARALTFPADHGPHTDFQTEWWYYTGNLTAQDGRRYGYQLTFFRRGITPGVGVGRASDWATNQIYFAHFAVTDANNNTHTGTEHFARGAAGLAGAQAEPFRVWLENWSSEGLNPEASELRLRADDGTMALDLTVRADKPPVVHGATGLSLKTETSGNASFYVSFTRMLTTGTLRIRGEDVAVSGTSWFDHEWGTGSLGAGAAGWDWFSIQLDDRRELMFFQIRNKDGSIEPLSSGTLVEADGTTRFLKREDVKITPQEFWTSGSTQARYPSQWRVESAAGNFDLTLTPLIADQEMRVSFLYWEGAVNITGTSNGRAVRGQGFVEMTGYAAQARGDVGY
jgi:predicted secreted hydrolase